MKEMSTEGERIKEEGVTQRKEDRNEKEGNKTQASE
jgi:hypothetical protein